MKRKGFIGKLAVVLIAAAVIVGSYAGDAKASVREGKACSIHCEKAVKSKTVKSKITFKDSLGRKVEIPKKIDKIAPSGGLANFVLYTLCPEKLVSSGKGFSEQTKGFVPEKYRQLPKTGSLYGRKATILPEEIIKLKPQIIIDIGEIKGGPKEMATELDKFQKKVNIPVIMIEGDVEKTLPEAYRTLGKLVGKEKKGEKLAQFCEKVMKRADKNTVKIPDSKKLKVYMATGKDGLQTETKGKMNVLPIDKVGGLNVVDLPENHGSTKTVSMEQLLIWQPDVILAESQELADDIRNDNLWKILPAVKNDKVYVIPNVPYSFMATPPASNQLLGIIWLGNLLYPEYNQYDMKKEITDFYRLFYHVNIGDTQLKRILFEK